MVKELFERICNEIPTDVSMEDVSAIEIDGDKYDWECVTELKTTDLGKYQCGGSIYAIGKFNEEEGYGIVGEPICFVEQDFVQTGSYYSGQEREYEKPYLVEEKEVVVTVWEAI